MGWFSGISKALSGVGSVIGGIAGGVGLGGLGFGLSNSKSDKIADTFDPGNFFHEGSAQREANRQWQLEYALSKQNYENQEKWNDLNYKHQIEAYNYQKELNALQMEREDTAVQRRVADLKSAGLSPTLAAGSAANATPVHAGTAPQGVAPQQEAPSDIRARAAMFAEEQRKDRMALVFSALGNISDISKTFAEKSLILAQKSQADAMRHYYDSQAEGQDIQNRYMDDFLSGRNYNQELQNYQLELKNSLDEQMNPIKVEQGLKSLRQADVDYDLSVMQKEINKNAILIQNEEIVAKQLQNKLAEEGYKYDLEDKRLRVASAAIALEQAQVDLAETKRVNKIWADKYGNMPPELRTKAVSNMIGTGHMLMRTLVDGIDAGVSKIAKKICDIFGFGAGPIVKEMPLQE